MRIEFDQIHKSFGPTEVLHGVSLSLEGGQILALLGENGAGKSTLMNILGGLLRPDAGEVRVDGQPVQFRTPNDSIGHGIAFIHQELSPVNDLQVYENVFLGRELRRGLFLDRAAMRSQAAQLLQSLDIPIDVDSHMRDLDASSKQIVEICRALQCQARVIIMDEPTTSLAEHEIALLFTLVRNLAAQGVGIIFISHKLNEVKELCSRYAVLRNGAVVAEGEMADVTTEELSEWIVGHELAHWQPARAGQLGSEVLRVDGISRGREFRDVSFSVRAGEILGITGLLGDGRSEVFRSLFGDTPDYEGRVFLEGQPFHARNTWSAVRAGLAYVPSNRKENAIVPDLSVLFNGTLATLRAYCRCGWLCRPRQEQDFQGPARDFRVKYGRLDDLITTLSGGNQQKVILARWLTTHPRLLVLDNPTQGVDIGAKQEIYDIVRRVAAEGMAVIVLSGEGQEIVRLCSRALVMYHGTIVGELQDDELNEHEIMRYATGSKTATAHANQAGE